MQYNTFVIVLNNTVIIIVIITVIIIIIIIIIYFNYYYYYYYYCYCYYYYYYQMNPYEQLHTYTHDTPNNVTFSYSFTSRRVQRRLWALRMRFVCAIIHKKHHAYSSQQDENKSNTVHYYHSFLYCCFASHKLSYNHYNI